MLQKLNSPDRRMPAEPLAKLPLCLLIGACVLVVAIGLNIKLRRANPPPASEAEKGQTVAHPPEVPTPLTKVPTPAASGVNQNPAAADFKLDSETPSLFSTTLDPTIKGLVRALFSSGNNVTNLTLSAEAIQTWRTNFQQLVLGGAAAVPALAAFLAQKQDVIFDFDTARALSYRSARLAAFDALRQIGGAEATALLDQTLNDTSDPKEIAALASDLEQLAPGQYRDKAFVRARDLLASLNGKPSPELDVAPLFELFQRFGDASVVPDLESAASQWRYYALSALANLPAEAGISTLVRMSDPSSDSGNRLVALEMLAQKAPSSELARQALTGEVAGKQIQPNLWPYLNASLAGDEFFPVDAVLTIYPAVQSWSDVRSTHVGFGNQNFYQLPTSASLTQDGISQRIALVSELMSQTSDQAAVETLQRVQATLRGRLARLAPLPQGPGN